VCHMHGVSSKVQFRIEISETIKNGAYANPTNLLYAVVDEDPTANTISWIGTNTGGSHTVSNSNLSTVFTCEIAQGDCLEVDSASTHTLKITLRAYPSNPAVYLVVSNMVLIEMGKPGECNPPQQC
jgi:hypothetical protein